MTYEPRNAAWHDWLVITYGTTISSILYRRMQGHSWATIQDLTQEVFTTAWKRRLDVPDDPLPWLYAVAKNHIRNLQRTRQWQQHADLHDELVDPDDRSATSLLEEIMDIRQAIASLTREERQLLWLSDVEAESSEDVGKRLGITSANARQRKKRVAKQVRKQLGESYLLQDHGDHQGSRF